MTTPRTEEDFQKKADEYAAAAIGSIREMINALEHAQECDGDCEECVGTGRVDTEGEEGGEEDCPTCKGTGKCQEGADSDSPDDWHDEDAARERIEEDALSVEVRGDWHTPGDESSSEPTEYRILLTTGGPAAQITGELRDGEPHSAIFEYQDWFKPWTEAYSDSADREVILKYARSFYFGE